MMILGQLPASQGPPPGEHLLSPTGDTRTGQLGNVFAQSVFISFSDIDSVMETYGTLFGNVPPFVKLVMLKRQKFAREGREARIAVSLAALNAPQPTELSVEQWKELLEEVEDED